MPIQPLAISAAASLQLRRTAKAPVLAHYRHGLEVRLNSEGGTLFVSPPGYGILPMHLILRRRDFDGLMAQPVGTPLFFGDGAETSLADIADTRTVVTLNARTINTFLPENDVSTFNRAALIHALHEIRQFLETRPSTGLGVSLSEVFDPSWPGHTAFVCGEDIKNSVNHAQAARFLLGRGQGATPAGDDMLLGALALQRALLSQPSPLVRTLAVLDSELPQRTTATSVAYLRWAQRGVFGSHLLSLVRDVRDGQFAERIARRARRVARHGASSGHDTLLGVVLAGRALLDAFPPPAINGI